MSNVGINISYLTSYGTRGSNDGEFDYPSGISFNGGNIYVVDRQNQRVQFFDSNFNFINKFGVYGTGSGEMNFPEGVAVRDANGYIFVCQSARHRITAYRSDYTVAYEIGTVRGSGLGQFDYPTDIVYYQDNIYICDKLNNRVQIYRVISQSSVTYVGEITRLNFPEGITIFQGKIYVADSASKRIRYYSLSGNYLGTINNPDFVYPTGLTNIDDQILMVIDKQGSKLFFYDYSNNFLTDYSTGLFYPEHAIYLNDKIYLTDSGNHRVVVFDAFIVHDISAFSSSIVRLTKQLYPTGRAWWMSNGSVFYKLHEALSYSEGRAYQKNRDILNSILPDNDNFSEEDAANWESVFGIYTSSSVSLSDRKKEIKRRIEYPGNIPARQDSAYLQSQLQKAGFDVYVFENHNNTYLLEPQQLGFSEVGEAELGGIRQTVPFTIIANYIDEALDNGFEIFEIVYNDTTEMGLAEVGETELGDYYGLREDLLNFTFFVCGQNFLDTATVPLNRKREFRELLLRLKPANSIGFLTINYI